MASWIEIFVTRSFATAQKSRLIWPRGLKFFRLPQIKGGRDVEAYMASWIEICNHLSHSA